MACKRKVLLAVDAGEPAEHAFDWYMANLHQPDNELLVFYCSEPPEIAMDFNFYAQHASLMAELEKQAELERKVKQFFTTKLEDSKVTGHYVSMKGQAGETIVQAAQDEKADYLVIGTRDQGLLARLFLGSVSSYVLHHARCPVIIVRPEDKSA